MIGYRKAVYDKFGEEGLRRGIPDSHGGKCGFLMHNKIFISLQCFLMVIHSMEMLIKCLESFLVETILSLVSVA